MTGSQAEAGTDICADIQVTLIGDKARSDGDKLAGWWQIVPNDKMQYVDLVMECSNSLGQLQVVILENRAQGKHAWYVDFLEVHDFGSEGKKVFPC